MRLLLWCWMAAVVLAVTLKPTRNPTTRNPTTLSPTPNPTSRSPTKNPTTRSPTRNPTTNPTTASPTPCPACVFPQAPSKSTYEQCTVWALSTFCPVPADRHHLLGKGDVILDHFNMTKQLLYYAIALHEYIDAIQSPPNVPNVFQRFNTTKYLVQFVVELQDFANKLDDPGIGQKPVRDAE